MGKNTVSVIRTRSNMAPLKDHFNFLWTLYTKDLKTFSSFLCSLWNKFNFYVLTCMGPIKKFKAFSNMITIEHVLKSKHRISCL